MPGNTEKISVLTLLKRVSIVRCLLGEFQFDLTRNLGASLKFSVGWLRRNYLHFIFLASLLKSAIRSFSFILVGVGAKPKPFSRVKQKLFY